MADYTYSKTLDKYKEEKMAKLLQEFHQRLNDDLLIDEPKAFWPIVEKAYTRLCDKTHAMKARKAAEDLIMKGKVMAQGINDRINELYMEHGDPGPRNGFDVACAAHLALIKRAIPDCTAKTLYEACKHMNEDALMDIVNQVRKECEILLTGQKITKEEEKEMPMPPPNFENVSHSTGIDRYYGKSYRLHQSHVIYKYPFKLEPGEFSIPLPDDVSILDCQVQKAWDETQTGVLWALLNPLHPVRDVHFAAVGTGHAFPVKWKRMDYIATVQNEPYVWHIFRIEKSPTVTPSTPED